MRYYNVGGRSLPSVTTILACTMSPEARLRLDTYYTSDPAALRENAEARRRGSEIDSWVKAFLLRSSKPQIDYAFSPYCRVIEALLEQWRSVASPLLVDHQVHHSANGYAGTIDLGLGMDGFVVVELKTKPFFFQPQIDEALIQAWAYAEAMESMGLSIKAVCAVWVGLKSYRLFWIEDDSDKQRLAAAWGDRLMSFAGLPSSVEQDLLI